MIPQRYAPLVAGLLMGSFMSFLISGVITAVNTGLDGGTFGRWMQAFPIAWGVAVPLASLGSFAMPHLLKRVIKRP